VHHRKTLSGYIFADKARIDNRKKLIKQQYVLVYNEGASDLTRCGLSCVSQTLHHRRQSFSCRRRTRVERSAAARNIRILSVYFFADVWRLTSSIAASLDCLCRAWAVTSVIFGHVNRSCYLLTYLLIIWWTFGPQATEISSGAYEFQRLSRLRSVTARYSSSKRQPNFAALNRGRHLYSAGRPSCWALAHILVSLVSLTLGPWVLRLRRRSEAPFVVYQLNSLHS